MPSPVVRFRCPSDLRDRMDEVAESKGMTRSGWIKGWIRYGIASDAQDADRHPDRQAGHPLALLDRRDADVGVAGTPGRTHALSSDEPPASKGARRDGRPRCSDHPLAVVLAGRCGACDGKVT